MNHIDTHWLTDREATRVHTLRNIAFAAQRDPLIIDRDPHTLAKIDYFTPSVKSCSQRCRMIEVFAYGDMAIILGLPGLSLTGMLLHLLAKQKPTPWLEPIIDGQYRTFIAVTEPDKGTDTKHMKSHLATHKHGHRLHADKCFVGKAAIAECGIIIAKHATNKLAIEAIFLDHETIGQYDHSPILQRETMPLTTLQAAHIGCLRIRNLELRPEHILNAQGSLYHTNQLLHQTFNLMRPTVGAMAFGMARAMLDHIKIHYKSIYCSPHQPWHKLRHQFDFLHHHHTCIAQLIDRDPTDLSLGSRAKLLGVSSLQAITEHLTYHDQYKLMLHDRWLSKWCRDAWGLDFMEGIAPIHYQNIFHASKRQHYLSTCHD
jgi:acyl-CoA dehydrogenase